jgi:hypothetical protein
MTDQLTPSQWAVRLFREMADRIEKNDPAEFGGAFLCISSNGDSPIIDALLVAKTPVEASFWGLVEGQLKVAMAQIAMNDRTNPGNFRR